MTFSSSSVGARPNKAPWHRPVQENIKRPNYKITTFRTTQVKKIRINVEITLMVPYTFVDLKLICVYLWLKCRCGGRLNPADTTLTENVDKK